MIQQAWQKQELKQHLSSSQRQVDLFLHDSSAFPSIRIPFCSWNWLASCDSIQESFLLANNHTLPFKASLALNLHHDLTAWVLLTKCLNLSFSKIQFCEKDEWPRFSFQARPLATVWMDLPWVRWSPQIQIAGAWGISFMWQREVSKSNRCRRGRKLVMFLVSPLENGGHGVYSQKFGNPLKSQFSFVQFSRSVVSDSLWPHALQHTRLPCPSPTPKACSNSCLLSWWGHPIISSSVVPFSSCLQSFPASGSFPMNQFFASGGQSTETSASASVLPMNIQNWFSLALTGLIPCSPRDSQELSPTPQFKSISSSVLSFLYGPTLTAIHDYWKNHSLDSTHLCQQSNVSAF